MSAGAAIAIPRWGLDSTVSPQSKLRERLSGAIETRGRTTHSQLANGRRRDASLAIRDSDVPRLDVGSNKVDGGEEGEGDGGDDEQHGGREEEENAGDAEGSGHVGLVRGGKEDTSQNSFYATLYRGEVEPFRDVTQRAQSVSSCPKKEDNPMTAAEKKPPLRFKLRLQTEQRGCLSMRTDREETDGER